MRQGDAVWGSLLAAGVAYEIAALCTSRDDDTLSRATRRWTYAHHPVGKVTFGIGWTAFSVWWVRHVIRGLA